MVMKPVYPTPMRTTDYPRTMEKTGEMTSHNASRPYVYERDSTSTSPHSTPMSSESPTAVHFRGDMYLSHSPMSEGAVPKLEPIEEDMHMASVEDDHTFTGTTSKKIPSAPERRRGRPKKEKEATAATSPITKTPAPRSKTGCITCRKRKKKCGEEKPTCASCKKNNVFCEGYEKMTIWTSGKQKKAAARRKSQTSVMPLPTVTRGVDTPLDALILKHFSEELCDVLSLSTDNSNPFKDIIWDMALCDEALMHALLCLSGRHLYRKTKNEELQERIDLHWECAVKQLKAHQRTDAMDDSTWALILVMCFDAVVAGGNDYRVHMDYARKYLQDHKTPNQRFRKFLVEFFVYHDVANSITIMDRPSVMMGDDFRLPEFMIQPGAVSLLGVVDGLFVIISRIRDLRVRVRDRRAERLGGPTVDMVIEANRLWKSIQEWTNPQAEGTPQHIAAELYQKATWLYLFRTINPSAPHVELVYWVAYALDLLQQLPEDDSTQNILLMPLFLMGCSAFDHAQRPAINSAFAKLLDHNRLGTIERAKTIVDDVWEMMDRGDENSWDWETIISRRGWDFLLA